MADAPMLRRVCWLPLLCLGLLACHPADTGKPAIASDPGVALAADGDHMVSINAADAPPPPPPVAAKTFIVFFNFDKSDLTPEAQAVVAEAAAAFKSTGSVSIAVVGHTDTVGSAAYNLPLSQRRAASVKAGLVANGVPGDVISTDGKGFSEPLVATGPGVKEPQNRRATIDLTGSGM